MTLLETERLIRKISELLRQVGNPEIAPKLAEDFATVCRASNLRLQQCEAMIKAGDRHQAIQLAETAPNLLDLVTVLEFRGADEWRSYCQQNTLPFAERIDNRSVNALNACYAQGVTTDDPLYGAYRRAILSRNDEEALKALQSITRLNPMDSNAAAELLRLDAKVLAARLQHLGVLLDGAEPSIVVAEIEAIEAFGFKKKPDGEVWRKAQAVRCRWLLGETAILKNASRWLDALAVLIFIHQLQNEFKVELSTDELEQIGAFESWASGGQEKTRKERLFLSLVGELHHRINQSEEKDTSSRYVKLPELKDDYEALHKVWRELKDFSRPIPEDATSRFKKRSALLEAEIVRRNTIRRRTIVSSITAVLVIGGGIVWFVMAQMKARDLAGQLQDAVAQRQAHKAEGLLERIHAKDAQLLSVGIVNAAAASAETFANKERALLTNYQVAFTKLPQQLVAESDASHLSALAAQLATARNALNALAPDLKTESEPRLQAFEKQWQSYLSERETAVNALFDQWVSSAEKQCSELDYRAPLEKVTAQFATLNDLEQKITDCESGFTNHLNLRSDLLQRSETFRAKFTAYGRELKKIQEGMASIQKARTVKGFSEGISLISSSEYSASPISAAAIAVQSLNANDETTLRILLGATNASTWSYIRKNQVIRFIPEVAMPAEQKILQQLNDDPAVSGIHQRLRLWLNPQGNSSVEWITSGLFENSTGWKQIKAWTASESATTADFNDHDYGTFDNQFKISATEPVYKIEKLGACNETASFSSVGLEKTSSTGGSYGKPLLEVLDSIKDSRQGSPVFRAYLFLRLIDLMKLQPDAWGLTFCPEAQEHETQIKSLVRGQLTSGDWFVPSKINAYSEKLEQFFATTKSLSYTKQSVGLLKLAQASSKDGLQYVGFVGLDGKANYIDNSVSKEVWGYSSINKRPIFLSAKSGIDKPLEDPVMPLSPLFALASPSKEYLTKAGVNPTDSLFQNALPPLFLKPLQP